MAKMVMMKNNMEAVILHILFFSNNIVEYKCVVFFTILEQSQIL